MPDIQHFGNCSVERLGSQRSIERRGGPCAAKRRLATGSVPGFYGYLGSELGRLNEAITDARCSSRSRELDPK